MLRQALDVAFDRLSNVVGRFGARSPLGNTAGQSPARGYDYPVLGLFQVNTILHHPEFDQSGESRLGVARNTSREKRPDLTPPANRVYCSLPGDCILMDIVRTDVRGREDQKKGNN